MVSGLLATAWYVMHRPGQNVAQGDGQPGASTAQTDGKSADAADSGQGGGAQPGAPATAGGTPPPSPRVEQPGADRPSPSPVAPTGPADEPAAQPGAEPGVDSGSDPSPPSPAEPPDPNKQAAFRQALADARQSMADRDIDGARRRLQEAAANAQTSEDRAQLERLQIMQQHLDEFWRVLRNSVAGLPYPSELPIGDTFVAVVEANPRQLTIKAAGRLEQYPVKGMPLPLLMAVVNKSFGKDPETQMIVGTFHAADNDGDPKRARQLWQQAARSGIDAAKRLLPELEAPGPGGGPSMRSILPSIPNQAGPPRVAPPTGKAALDEAKALVQTRFGDQFAAATSHTDKESLARELVTRAKATDDDALRMVILEKARDLAVSIGRPGPAVDAVDTMADHFQVDALKLKADLLGRLVGRARGFESHRDIATEALKVGHEAFQRGDRPLARQMADLALEAARRSGSATLMHQAAAAGKQLDAQRRGQ